MPQSRKKVAAFAATGKLLFAERLAVSTLVHSRILLVGAHHNAVQRAVVFGVAVIGAGLDGAFDALVCMAIHNDILLFVWYSLSMNRLQKRIQEKSVILAF